MHSEPTFSPDGRYAYVVSTSNDDVVVIDLRGGVPEGGAAAV